MNINESGTMTANELTKAGKLLTKAGALGMDTSGYGSLDVNKTSGYVYLWLEDYNFTIFIAPSGSAVKALYSCPYDGEESIKERIYSLQDLEMWADKRAKESEEKETA